MDRTLASGGLGCNGPSITIGHDNQSIGHMVKWRKSLMHYREWYHYVIWRIAKALKRIRQFVA
jgi:hypothetical protein